MRPSQTSSSTPPSFSTSLSSEPRPELDSPLVVLSRYLREHGEPDAAGVATLADQLATPPAAVRGVMSYYTDLALPQGQVRYCHGTSCRLAGGRDGARSESEGAGVYCLGYCDRSPARIDDEERVCLRSIEGAWVPASDELPSIRCLAPEPIVTRNLLEPGAANLEVARRRGVYGALAKALSWGEPLRVIEAVEASGERGRGGAGFPTGAKWRRCAEAVGRRKVVVANGDEGDPGSFIDRLLMEEDPHSLLEGMALCAYGVGADRGIVFVRGEYPRALARLRKAVDDARTAGLLGPRVLGHDFAFEVTIFPGYGSYVCGEETALLAAIEGRRGEVRLRPPFPTDSGLWGRPTVVNNVETFGNVPWILERGPEAYRALGTTYSAGTKAICLNRGFARPGVVEVEMGAPLDEILLDEAGGGRDGEPLAAVLLGGPMGTVLTPDEWSVPICYGAMGVRGIQLGHGGLVAIPESADFPSLVEHMLAFARDESCGRCVPCREGSSIAWERARERTANGKIPAAQRPWISRVLGVMEAASLCAFGQGVPAPVAKLCDAFGDRIFDDAPTVAGRAS